MGKQDYFEELIGKLRQKKLSKLEISNLKISLCKRHGLKEIPTDFEIAMNASPSDRKKLGMLQSKPGRTGSGVAVVAIMTRPSDCPHGRCSYCPGGLKSFFGNVPQSYTGKEPATLRGIRNNYDPYLQVFNRLEQYTILGHSADKVELIIMGGTFIAQPKKYRDEFVAYSLKAMNDFSDIFYSKTGFRFEKFKAFFGLPGNIGDSERVGSVRKALLKLKGKADLEEEQERNERSRIRCVAMCLETRPDYCKKEHINEMLRLGTTRVEMGVQSLDDSVLRKVERGHTVEDSITATALLRDSLLKVGYHMMPGLPETTEKHDLEMLKKLFSDPRFRPDALKIYPCMVMPGTRLFEDYKKGRFKPLTTEKAAELISEFKRYVPEYCRIMRVQRDIPTTAREAGVDRTNLRQYVDRLLREKGIKCRCIRCREPKGRALNIKNIRIKAIKYEASGGTEIFIAAEDPKKDVLAGFCRLRIPNKPFRKELTGKSSTMGAGKSTGKCAGIRELHVYGEMAGIGEEGRVQHHGIGKRLLAEAERLAKQEFGRNKMVIISGIGAREYYRKLGYRREGPYMTKNI
jgi:elongator complex protein 3